MTDADVSPAAGQPSRRWLEVDRAAGRAFVQRGMRGELLMLNLLRFRDRADYSHAPELAPPEPISGAEAYRRYVAHTLPLLRRAGGELLWIGEAGPWLIGPPDELWHAAMLVRQRSVADFLAFADDPENRRGLGHRTAALVDARLLPITLDQQTAGGAA